ncbi:MAG: LCP family protein [Anaerolineales bacterium]|jgi:LCP family protein required for cell wall assembly
MDDTQLTRTNKKRKRRKSRPLNKTEKIILGALLVAAIISAVLVFQFVREMIVSATIVELPGVNIQPAGDSGGDSGTSQDGTPAAPLPVSDAPAVELPTWDGASRVNILVMGLDAADWYSVEREGPPKTDSMILATYDPVTKTAAMLSIPRDLWVNIPGFGQNKINQAYALGEGARVPGGGPGMAAKTVEEFLGIDIHYYAQIDFHAFVDFIDFIGGVCVDVQSPIELEIPGKFIDVKLEPGMACMKGDHLLAYIRNRYVNDGDFDRSRRQQQAIIAIRDKMLSREIQGMILNDPLELWNIFSTGIQTNIPFDDALSLGLDALKINPSQIGQYVISPPDYVKHATSPDGLQEILKPITGNIRILRDEIFTSGTITGPAAAGGDPTELMKTEAATIGIYNGSGISGLAGSTQEYLISLGVNVVDVGNADYVSLTTIYDYTGNPYTVQYLVGLMGINNTRIFNSYDPNSTIDVRIELGEDWSVPGQ